MDAVTYGVHGKSINELSYKQITYEVTGATENSIVIDEDANGDAFSFQEAHVLIDAQAWESEGWDVCPPSIYGRINDVQGYSSSGLAGYVLNNIEFAAVVGGDYSNQVRHFSYSNLYVEGGLVCTIDTTSYQLVVSGDPYYNNLRPRADNKKFFVSIGSAITEINKLTIFLDEGQYFPIGTKIYIRGR